MPRDFEVAPYLAQVGQAQARAKNDLVLSHLLLAVKLAGQYRNRGVSYADLVGEANLALVEAARDYPKSKAKAAGVPFATYAARAIRCALLDAIRMAEPAHVERNAWLLMRRCESAELSGHSEEAIAAELGLPAPKVRRLLDLARTLRTTVAWDDPLDAGEEDSGTFADVAPDPSADVEGQVLGAIEREGLRRQLAEAIESLPETQRLAISLKFAIPVASLPEVALDTVLRGCESSSYTENGMARMRKVVRHEGDGSGAVVSGRRPGVVSRIDSPLGPGKPARIRRDEDFWRRIASQPPPAVLVAAQ